jgi:hypothetical protein
VEAFSRWRDGAERQEIWNVLTGRGDVGAMGEEKTGETEGYPPLLSHGAGVVMHMTLRCNWSARPIKVRWSRR